MSLVRVIGAVLAIAMAYLVLVFMPSDLPPKYETGLDIAAALVAFGTVAWVFVPTRKH